MANFLKIVEYVSNPATLDLEVIAEHFLYQKMKGMGFQDIPTKYEKPTYDLEMKAKWININLITEIKTVPVNITYQDGVVNESATLHQVEFMPNSNLAPLIITHTSFQNLFQ